MEAEGGFEYEEIEVDLGWGRRKGVAGVVVMGCCWRRGGGGGNGGIDGCGFDGGRDLVWRDIGGRRAFDYLIEFRVGHVGRCKAGGAKKPGRGCLCPVSTAPV